MSNEPKPMDSIMQHVPDTSAVEETPPLGAGVPRSRIIPQDDVTEETTAPAPAGFRMLTPEEAAQLGSGEKVDVQKELDQKGSERIDAMVNAGQNQMVSLLEGALGEEEARIERHENALETDEYRETLASVPGTGGKVQYEAPIDNGLREKRRIPGTEDQEEDVGTKKASTSAAINRGKLKDQDQLDLSTFMPSYDNDEEEEKEEEALRADDKPDNGRPDPEDDDEEYKKYIQGLELSTTVLDPAPVVQVMRERRVSEPVTPDRLGKAKVVTDQAFMSAITKYRKDNFRTVSVPLVNSGFSVHMVGTGAVDLNMLYDRVNQNTEGAEYEIEKMRVVLQNVVGTSPKVNNESLRSMIHFADYNLMAYAHIAATLKDVEMIHTCEECGKDFHIQSPSTDLILNMDELRTRMNEIKSADSIEQYSLMVMDRRMTTDSGFTINLGHPSYAEYIKYLNDVENLRQNLPRPMLTRVTRMAGILPFVRSIVMPNQITTSTLLQRFHALCMLSSDELNDVEHEVKLMVDKIIMPRFGIKRVECPYCHKVNTEIAYDNLGDLVFFHFMVTQLMNSTEE